LRSEQLYSANEQCVVCKRAKKLCNHDGVKTRLHLLKAHTHWFHQRFKRIIKSHLNQRISFLEC
jgi:glutaredoxin